MLPYEYVSLSMTTNELEKLIHLYKLWVHAQEAKFSWNIKMQFSFTALPFDVIMAAVGWKSSTRKGDV